MNVQPLTLLINALPGSSHPPLQLSTPDMRTSLIVADINMPDSPCGAWAEIWQQDRCLARVRKRHLSQQTYWDIM